MQIKFFPLDALPQYLEGRNGAFYWIIFMASMVTEIRSPRSSISVTFGSSFWPWKNHINNIRQKNKERHRKREREMNLITSFEVLDNSMPKVSSSPKCSSYFRKLSLCFNQVELGFCLLQLKETFNTYTQNSYNCLDYPTFCKSQLSSKM